MRLGLFALLSSMMLAVACGGSKTLDDGGTGLTGGGLGGGGNGGNGGSISGSCNAPCLVDVAKLVEGCSPGGTCTMSQTAGTTSATINECFSNGVKVQVVANMSTGSDMAMQFQVKKGSSVCYLMAMTMSSTADAETMAIKNSSGTTVATLATDAAGDMTVTCPGKSPIAMDQVTCSDYDSSTIDSTTQTSTAGCTEGTCTY